MSDSTVTELKRISFLFMDRTGEQLFMHTERPESTKRYVFNNRAITSPAKALEYANEMLAKAQTAPTPVLVDVHLFGENTEYATRVFRHDTYKHSAALLVHGAVVESTTTITEEDARQWAKNKQGEYA